MRKRKLDGWREKEREREREKGGEEYEDEDEDEDESENVAAAKISPRHRLEVENVEIVIGGR